MLHSWKPIALLRTEDVAFKAESLAVEGFILSQKKPLLLLQRDLPLRSTVHVSVHRLEDLNLRVRPVTNPLYDQLLQLALRSRQLVGLPRPGIEGLCCLNQIM